jgi:hypothetical protein
METSSISNTSSLIKTATFALVSFDKSSLLLYYPQLKVTMGFYSSSLFLQTSLSLKGGEQKVIVI